MQYKSILKHAGVITPHALGGSSADSYDHTAISGNVPYNLLVSVSSDHQERDVYPAQKGESMTTKGAIFGIPSGEMSSDNNWIESYTHPVLQASDGSSFANKHRIEAELQITYAVAQQHAIIPQDILVLACGPSPLHIIDMLRHYPKCSIVASDYVLDFLQSSSQALRDYASDRRDIPPICTDRVTFQEGDMRNIAIPDHVFDIITIYGNSFLFFGDDEHQEMLKSMYTLLKTPGLLFITVPKHEYVTQLKDGEALEWEKQAKLPNGDVITERSRRTYNPTIRRSVGEHIYTNQSNEVILTVYSSCATYPFESGDPAEISLSSIGKQAGFTTILRERVRQDRESKGLMANMEMIVYCKEASPLDAPGCSN